MNIIVALWAGLLFGIGLILSGMTNPAKVRAVLDLAGNWDPSPGLVMLGALLATAPAYALARRRGRTLTGGAAPLLFFLAMLAGMGVFAWLERRQGRDASADQSHA